MPAPIFTLSDIISIRNYEIYYEATYVSGNPNAGRPPKEGQLWPRGNAKVTT